MILTVSLRRESGEAEQSVTRSYALKKDVTAEDVFAHGDRLLDLACSDATEKGWL